jgi:hypothetical protein
LTDSSPTSSNVRRQSVAERLGTVDLLVANAAVMLPARLRRDPPANGSGCSTRT